MQVTVKLFATLRKYAKKTDTGICNCELKNDSTVESVLHYLKIPKNIPIILLLNGQQTNRDVRLHDGDTLNVFPPIAGG